MKVWREARARCKERNESQRKVNTDADGRFNASSAENDARSCLGNETKNPRQELTAGGDFTSPEDDCSCALGDNSPLCR